MIDNELYRQKLIIINRNINVLRNMYLKSTTNCQRLFYQEQLFNQITRYKYLQKKFENKIQNR